MYDCLLQESHPIYALVFLSFLEDRENRFQRLTVVYRDGRVEPLYRPKPGSPIDTPQNRRALDSILDDARFEVGRGGFERVPRPSRRTGRRR